MKYECEFAVRAVRAACRLSAAVGAGRDRIAAATKQDRSPVTVADYGSQAVVCRMLGSEFPADRVIAEESSAELAKGSTVATALLDVVRDSFAPDASLDEIRAWIEHGRAGRAARAWILDPVDGTKGFLRGGQYAVALALAVNGRVELGVLGCPNLAAGNEKGCLFIARRGAGAWQAPLDDPGARSPVHVSEMAAGPALSFAESFESAHTDHHLHRRIAQRLGAAGEPLRLDSQAKYGLVARGEASAYLRLPSPATPDYREKVWDHAAGALLVEEAGGRVTDVHGEKLDFTKGERLAANRGAVASNGRCHRAIIEAIAALT